MNNKDINLKYKLKYFKYKIKYLHLKNQLGGVHFNNQLNRCIVDKYDKEKYENYPIYDPIKNRCCNNEQYTDCKNILHTIDHARMLPEYGIPTPHYNFSKDSEYKGTDIITRTITNKKKSYDIKVYKSFIKGQLKFNYNNDIGSGAYGLVLQYWDVVNDKYIAVKYNYKAEYIAKDKKVIEHINKNVKECSELVIDSIIYEDDNLSCIIMENAVGTIDKLKPAIQNNKSILIDILYAIVIAIKCLYDKGLYYIDIKMKNILYRNTDNGIQIILGDIGGVVTEDEESFSTYFPYEYKLIKYEKLEEKKSIISWGIGILILSLLNISHKKINNRNINNNVKNAIINSINPLSSNNQYIDDEVQLIIELLKEKGYCNIVNIIEKTLCNSDDRDDLTEIIKKINFLRLQ